MDVRLLPAAIDDKPVLRNLLELYRHDFSEFDGSEVDEHGLFGYRYLDHYWTEPGRFPFLIRAGGRIAGFALVGYRTRLIPHGTGRELAEFFVLRGYRRRGVGRAAAIELFDRFPGAWEVAVMRENIPARRFWDAIIAEYAQRAIVATWVDEGRWAVYSFTSREGGGATAP